MECFYRHDDTSLMGDAFSGAHFILRYPYAGEEVKDCASADRTTNKAAETSRSACEQP
jgi:hypothetical protein